jgi:hypothetical protein
MLSCVCLRHRGIKGRGREEVVSGAICFASRKRNPGKKCVRGYVGLRAYLRSLAWGECLGAAMN